MSKDLNENDQNNQLSCNGRWSDQEHEKFILGLQIYGRDWKNIEKLIHTRNGAQIRSHAQKFFLKCKKQTNQCQEEQICRQNNEFNSQLTVNSKSTEQNQEKNTYSYFLGKIVQYKHKDDQFDFWQALIDQKNTNDFQNAQEYQDQLNNNKRKFSFQVLERNQISQIEIEPIKKIKI